MTKTGRHLVSNRSWDRYKKHIKQFLDKDAGRQRIIWAKHVDQLLSHGEDNYPWYFKIEIEALCYYNAFRNWPLNEATVSGELDEENLSILVSRDFIMNLEDGKYFKNDDGGETDGYWNFNWQQDRFSINGVVYRPCGDTQVAQAKDEALVFMVILKRDRDSELNYINT